VISRTLLFASLALSNLKHPSYILPQDLARARGKPSFKSLRKNEIINLAKQMEQ